MFANCCRCNIRILHLEKNTPWYYLRICSPSQHRKLRNVWRRTSRPAQMIAHRKLPQNFLQERLKPLVLTLTNCDWVGLNCNADHWKTNKLKKNPHSIITRNFWEKKVWNFSNYKRKQWAQVKKFEDAPRCMKMHQDAWRCIKMQISRCPEKWILIKTFELWSTSWTMDLGPVSLSVSKGRFLMFLDVFNEF